MNYPYQIAEDYAVTGAMKAESPVSRIFIMALFAGLFIGLGGLGSSIASSGLTGGFAKLMGACVFPVGLVMVILTGAELFTGNNLILISALSKKTSYKSMLVNWGIVWLGNLIGAVILAVIVVFGHTLSLFDGELARAAVATAQAKVSLSFVDAFMRGILCNILVCMGVYMAVAADEVPGKILCAMLPVMLFVLCGFEHCVANFYFIPTGIFASYAYNIDAQNLSWLTFLLKNAIPVTLGNVVGGSLFVALPFWWVFLKDE